MQSLDLKIKDTLYGYIDEMYAKFEKYDYALICDNGLDYLDLIDSEWADSECISLFMTEKYGYEVYIFRTALRYTYILVFNTSNCANFSLNLRNICSLYEKAEISFEPIPHRSTLLFHRFSAAKIISIKKIGCEPPSTFMGKWGRSLLIEKTENTLEKHKLHYLWFDFSDSESLSISRYKYNDEFVWAMVYHNHYDIDLTGGIILVFFHPELEFVEKKFKEYINLLNQHKIRGAMFGFSLLDIKWSGNDIYKEFWFSDYVHSLNCELFYHEEFGSYYSFKS